MITEKKLEAVKLASHLLAENLYAVNGSISDETSDLVVKYGTACQEFGSRGGFLDGFTWGVAAATGVAGFTAFFFVTVLLPELKKEHEDKKRSK